MCNVRALLQKVVNLIDSDSSIDEPEDAEELDDVNETFNVEDDIFIDDVKSTKIERLSECNRNIEKSRFSPEPIITCARVIRVGIIYIAIK